MSQDPTFQAKLHSARALSPSVRELVFERVDGAPVSYEAGQWVKLVLPVGEGLKRAYSIASAPDGTPRFTLAVTRVTDGPGSNYMHEMSPGDELTFFPPQGLFVRGEAESGPGLFIATGTGLTPLWSMIQGALRRGETSHLWLLFGVRNEDEILYREDILGLARRHPNFRVEFTLSQPTGSWTGRRGYVQTHLPELWAELRAASAGGATPNAFICGLKGMVGSVRELLRDELQVPRENVHTERYN